MKIRTRARYSLRFMIALGKLSSPGEPVGLGDISRQSGISRRYLDHLVVPLKNASLIRGRSGRAGGYVLARTAEAIKLGDIIEAAIGPVAITDCAVEPELCIFSDYCNCKDLWTLINRRITAVLDEYTLADMLSDSWPAKIRDELRKLDTERSLVHH
jgi:Rrf2 family cysteine metabolism transcriptional repressor